jgi:hypothetical protein
MKESALGRCRICGEVITWQEDFVQEHAMSYVHTTCQRESEAKQQEERCAGGAECESKRF